VEGMFLGRDVPWKGEGYISVVEVIFALSLSASAAANSLVDDDDNEDTNSIKVSYRDVNFFQ